MAAIDPASAETERALEARRERAAARRAQPMTSEIFQGFPEDIGERDSTIAERIGRMTRLIHSAWLASGREISRLPRRDWPGEVFVIERRR